MTRLRSRGWRVYACGHRPEGPGVEAADKFFLVDILDVDAVEALCRRTRVDLVYSVGSDIAMPTVAAVSERLGLPSFHDLATTELLHQKVELRRFLDRAGLSVVAHRRLQGIDDLDGFAAYPAIVKPSDAQGQRGIAVVADRAEAERAVPAALDESASRTGIIEEWLDGREISVHVFIVDGEVRFSLPSDRHVWEGPLTGIPAGHRLPSRWLSEGARVEVEDLIEAVVHELGIGTGPLYFQLKLTTRGGPRIIEIAPRLDGCHLWRLIEQHTGFNLLDACFDLLAGEGWTDPLPWSDDPGHTLWFLLTDPSVAFHRADHPPPPGAVVVYEELQVAEGGLPRDTNGIVARAGYRIVEEP
jgi:biotin carboxylase